MLTAALAPALPRAIRGVVRAVLLVLLLHRFRVPCPWAIGGVATRAVPLVVHHDFSAFIGPGGFIIIATGGSHAAIIAGFIGIAAAAVIVALLAAFIA